MATGVDGGGDDEELYSSTGGSSSSTTSKLTSWFKKMSVSGGSSTTSSSSETKKKKKKKTTVDFDAMIAKDSEDSGLDSHLIDHTFGMFLSAAIGDSLGSAVEFSRRSISKSAMKSVFKMNGGGPHRIAAGQVTDDTELAVALARGIAIHCHDGERMKKKTMMDDDDNEERRGSEGERKEEISTKMIVQDSLKSLLQCIAKEYYVWYQSNPFDRGSCTNETCSQGGSAERMKSAALKYDAECRELYASKTKHAPIETRYATGNLANGSLMRCTPLIAYGWRLKNDVSLAKLMKADSSLTHANPYVYLVNACYAIAIRYLLTNNHDDDDEDDRDDDDADHDHHFKKPRNMAAFDRVLSFLDEELDGAKGTDFTAVESEEECSDVSSEISGMKEKRKKRKTRAEEMKEEASKSSSAATEEGGAIEASVKRTHDQMYPRSVYDVRLWMEHIKEGRTEKFNEATVTMGFIKIAFEHAFFSLRNNWSLKEALDYSISQGGDTDTNGCIVGGMVGALHGLSAVDHPEWLEKVMRCSPVRSGNRAHFHPKLCFNPEFIPDGQNFLLTILKNAPSEIDD